MILVLHTNGAFKWGWAPLTSLGHGVSFFFVLSGFILTHVYTAKPIQSYGQFVQARVARVWPLHVASLLLLVFAVPSGAVTFDGAGIFSRWVVLGFNVTLVHSIFPYFAYTFSWNSVSWSISTEWFFYLTFPFLLVNIRRTWHWKLVASLVLALLWLNLLAALRLPVDGGLEQATVAYGTYANPIMRGFEFSLGIAAWVWWERLVKPAQLSRASWSVIEMAVVILAAIWLGFGYQATLGNWPEGPSQLWVKSIASCWLFALLIIVLAAGRGVLGSLLSWRPLVYLGKISFAIYMVHQVMIKIFIVTLKMESPPAWLFFGAVLAAASLSYWAIERPTQRFINDIHRRRKFLRTCARSTRASQNR